MTQQKTGYPSIDRPWLKYYSEEAVSAPLPECTVYEYLWRQNKDYSNNVALNYFENKITFGELFENIYRTAAAFSAMGVQADDIVILATVTTPETVYAFYGLNRLGAISNMIDPRTSVEGIRSYIQEVSAKVVLVLDAAYAKIEQAVKGTSVEKIIVVSPAESLRGIKRLGYRLTKPSRKLGEKCVSWPSFIAAGLNTVFEAYPYRANQCCVIVHTGGTTGAPKGVMLSNDNLNASVLQCDLSGFNFQRHHKWLGVMPPFIAYGIGNGLHLPLCKGMTLIVLPKFDPKKYDDLLIKYRPNHIAGVPSHYYLIAQSKKMRNLNLSFLLSPIVGGDGIDVRLERRVNHFFQNRQCPTNLIKGYGMTEICAAVTATARNEYNKEGSVGIPFTHSAVGIFDVNSGEEIGFNKTGEVCMRGPHIMLGYYNNDSETKNVLRKHNDGSVWLHSGDLGYMDEDGCLYIQGRLKRLIVRHDGFKVFPALIETVIASSNDIVLCCVVGQNDTSHGQGQLPVAFCVTKENCTSRIEDIEKTLREKCQTELPEYAQPIQFCFRDTLPLTPIGKIDYRALEALAGEQ